MTANVMEGDRERCLAAGMGDYITKPFKSADFKEMLDKWAVPAPEAEANKSKAVIETKKKATAVAVEANPTQGVSPLVLIVDDNLVNQKLSAKFLQKLGCEVSIVDNGKKAVEEVKGKTFDIVFMDCQMPIMDGYEATRTILSRGHRPLSCPDCCNDGECHGR